MGNNNPSLKEMAILHFNQHKMFALGSEERKKECRKARDYIEMWRLQLAGDILDQDHWLDYKALEKLALVHFDRRKLYKIGSENRKKQCDFARVCLKQAKLIKEDLCKPRKRAALESGALGLP
jgi:hypothetical protein